MPQNEGFSKIVAMGEYLSGWVEAKALRNADSKSVAVFVHEWIVRFGIPGMIIHDNGSENKKITKILIDRFTSQEIIYFFDCWFYVYPNLMERERNHCTL